MISIDKIRVGKYKQYTGPWYPGSVHLDFNALTYESPEHMKRMYTISSTEGGSPDAINMYDVMILTVGIIQWGDRKQFKVCELLGKIVEAGCDWSTIKDYAAQRGYVFNKTAIGYRWFDMGANMVAEPTQQQVLYLKNSNGVSWPDDGSLDWAKGWAAAMQDVLCKPDAVDVQVKYTLDHLLGFVMPNVMPKLFIETDNDIVKAMQSIYLSFAANNPSYAGVHYNIAQSKGLEFGTLDWLVETVKEMTFGPGVGIYAERYNKMRAVVERFYNIDIPDNSTELAKFHAGAPQHGELNLHNTKDLQTALINLGYDLGPSGADGLFGKKSKSALVSFQATYRLTPDGIPGPATLAQLQKVLEQTSQAST